MEKDHPLISYLESIGAPEGEDRSNEEEEGEDEEEETARQEKKGEFGPPKDPETHATRVAPPRPRQAST